MRDLISPHKRQLIIRAVLDPDACSWSGRVAGCKLVVYRAAQNSIFGMPIRCYVIFRRRRYRVDGLNVGDALQGVESLITTLRREAGEARKV